METTAQVAIRILPLRPNDPSFNQQQISYKENTLKISLPDKPLESEFDKVFGPFESQENIFNFICPIIESYDKGISSTILAYGQTGSGKTYTMFGNSDNHGIIPRVISHIFRVLSSDYTVRFSMIKIYNEKITDLLAENIESRFLSIRKHPDYGIYIQNLSEYVIKSPDEALSLIEKGKNNCRMQNTMMSLCNFRLTIICQITIINTSFNRNHRFYKSKITLCDLLGSERVEKTRAYNLSLKETININKSIQCLQIVIFNLTKNNGSHIPFRDSKLTFLLNESLEGKHRLALIGTLNPGVKNLYESFYTIRFANLFKQTKIKIRTQEITLKTFENFENFERQNMIIKKFKENYDEGKIYQEEFRDAQNFNDRIYCKNIEKIMKKNKIMKYAMIKYLTLTEKIVEVVDFERKQFGCIEIKNDYKKRRRSCSTVCRWDKNIKGFKMQNKSSIIIDNIEV
ncbi:hypothetical protein SteCoe_33371 [Stentor coeruleus]|uniref:Kinesin motor domain-containing protein n=1 Tax=Stentor coeruleus TaxID=5963 RepID=A0A1R2AWW0_9CILI|nr:hypothetical protein SteCoe_33371 [Stentor coeruleus]